MQPNTFWSKLIHNFYSGKKLLIIRANAAIKKILPKENNHPKGENSHNLVTLSSGIVSACHRGD
jgi:hypothetical protein